MGSKAIKTLVLVLIPLIMWFITPPEGLAQGTWRLFGFYLTAIVGLVLKPFPVPVVVLSALAASALFLGNAKAVLSGYSSTSLWLIFAAFGLAVAFGNTGLGHRIAYWLVRAFGSTVLRLGYVNAVIDLILAMGTPSNTARAAGIIFPINQSIAQAVGSNPGETAKKAGSYLLQNGYMVTKVTSFIFMTAMAPNLLALDYVTKITGVSLNWGTWALAMIIPGLVILLFVPLIGYFIERPTATKIDNKKIAAEGLEKLGPMKTSEKCLITIFVLAIIGWVLPTFGIKIDATAVALVAMVLTFLLKIVKWEDLLKNKGAWNTFIWFGGILGMSSALTKGKFFEWLAGALKEALNFNVDQMVMMIIIAVISVAVRYFFASGTAYIAAMLPVFLIVGINAGVHPVLLSFVLLATNSFGGAVTHYGAAPGPIIFAAGYNNLKSWWTVGAVTAIVALIITFVVGIPWWHITGFLK